VPAKKNQAIESNDLGPFYNRIDTVDNTFRSISANGWMKMHEYFYLADAGGSAYWYFRSKVL